jgi:surface polysaccharide O-acyltransferase-like enzyme
MCGVPGQSQTPSPVPIALGDRQTPCSVTAEEACYRPALGVLRVTAAFGVAALHVISLWLRDTDPGTTAWWIADFYDAATRWCVPVFIMISGALLLKPHVLQPPTVFYRRRMGRILIPLMFWTTFYLGLRVCFEGISGPIVVRDVVRGHPYGHLWYLYVVVGLYWITPLLQPFVGRTSRRELVWTVVPLLAAVSAHSLVSTFTAGQGKPTVFSLFVGYIPYYLCGYLLSLVVVPPRWIKYLAAGVAAVWIGIALGTGLLFHRIEFYLSSHHSPAIILLSAGLFLLASGLFGSQRIGRAHLWKVLRYLDSMSFGIYLSHPLFLFIVMRLGLPTPSMLRQPLLCIPAISLIIILASILLTSCLKAIPAVRRTV